MKAALEATEVAAPDNELAGYSRSNIATAAVLAILFHFVTIGSYFILGSKTADKPVAAEKPDTVPVTTPPPEQNAAEARNPATATDPGETTKSANTQPKDSNQKKPEETGKAPTPTATDGFDLP